MAHARTTDPSTSFEAAASVKNMTETQKAIAMLLLTPRTDEDLVDAYYTLADRGGAPYASPSGIRSRRAELTMQGVVVATLDRVKLRSGRHAIVWKTI